MKNIILEAIIPEDMTGMRIDLALAKLFPDYSRGRIQTWIKSNFVKIDGQIPTQKYKVRPGQVVTLSAKLENEESNQMAEDIPLNIIYEDQDLLVINKPVGLVVHPGAGNKKHTLMNALLHHVPELEHIPRAGIVHRLDKDTSGLLVVAKNLATHNNLIQQLQQRTIERIYQAIVTGVIISGKTISAPIGRHSTQRTKMAVTDSGREAITHFRVLEKFRAHTLIQLQLETGRTHQIRVHMAHIHHAVVGDQQYAGRFKFPANISAELRTALQNFKHQALHAWKLTLQHPRTKEVMSWEAPLPADMIELVDTMREDKGKL